MTMLLYAAQVRIERRFPPRPVPLPNFLPLKRAEWYITFGFLATVESENSRNYNRTKRDPDLCVLEAAALKAKVSWKARKKTVKMENMPFLQSDVGRSCTLFDILQSYVASNSFLYYSRFLSSINR